MMKKIFLLLNIFSLAIFGWIFFEEYMVMHPYYTEIINNVLYRKLFGAGIISSLIPTLHIMFSKRKSFWGVYSSIVFSLFLFLMISLRIKGDFLGGGVKLFFNVLFFVSLMMFFVSSMISLGSWIRYYLIKIRTLDSGHVFIDIGLGLVLFLTFVYLLLFLNIFYTPVVWISFLFLIFITWTQRHTLGEYRNIYIGKIKSFRWISGDLGNNILFVLCILLLLVSFRYFFNGFSLAYLPYPTAWDANHAYMFYPKMWSLNNGLFRDELGMLVNPQFRYFFVAYFFKLFTPGGFFGIAPDTIAIEMNFLSGPLVLLFGIGVSHMILHLLQVYTGEALERRTKLIFIFLGWFLFLLRLTSGMGAFLVFIDNKLDLGMMSLILLALYSGFFFLHYMYKRGDGDKGIQGNSAKKYIILSAVFYAFAVLAKPTAMFDVVNFFIFLWSLWIGFFGSLGIILIVVAMLVMMRFRDISNYLSTSFSIPAFVLGGLSLLFNVVFKQWKRVRSYLMYFLLRGCVFLGILIIIKTPFFFAKNYFYKEAGGFNNLVQYILFSQNSEGVRGHIKNRNHLDFEKNGLLYAQAGSGILIHDSTGNQMGYDECIERKKNLRSTSILYKGLESELGNAYEEDVGRYVGYGRKGNDGTDARRGISPFKNPWRGFLFSSGCHAFNPLNPKNAKNAKILCDYEDEWKSFDQKRIQGVLNKLDPLYSGYQELGVFLSDLESGKYNVAGGLINGGFVPSFRAVDKYMQENSIKVEHKLGNKIIYFPYRFLNPFNISFNRSLQNLSSYYTDIGVVRLMLFIILFLSLLYAILSKEVFLLSISTTTLFGRLLRRLIGGGILWYAIGIIAWTIIYFLIYCFFLFLHKDTHNHKNNFVRIGGGIFLVGFLLFGGYQLFLNMMRISSQGGSGPFSWYKTNYGIHENYSERLEPKIAPGYGFDADNVFDMQFAHYKKFLDIKNNGDTGDGALIAGTYARYFVQNQQNVVYDQFLIKLGKWFSDGDVCKSYLRLKDKNIKYIVVDPNIGTVVQGAGNQSLFDRFFAKLDASGTNIVKDGVITMIMRMLDAGYLRYISSNNLGAKYVLLGLYETGSVGEDAIVEKSKVMVGRFFGARSGSHPFVQKLLDIAIQRVYDGSFVDDVADILGLDIDEDKLVSLIQKQKFTADDILLLTHEEKKALAQYLGIRQLFAVQKEQGVQQLTNLILNSINIGNQIIVLEIK